jgi:hypothetical protein
MIDHVPSKLDNIKFYKQKNSPLRPEVDLRTWDSLVEDQGKLGSCGSEAMTSAYELMVRRLYPEKFVELSRLFVYYNTRVLEETIEEDSGVTIKDEIDAVKKHGICSESLWPYVISKFSIRPPNVCYTDAKQRTITNYESLDSTEAMIEVLNDDRPVLIGADIFKKFMRLDDHDPIVSMPNGTEQSLGGHAMVAVGYSLPKKQFLVKNSFGVDWGVRGYCWIPFEYEKDHIFERWCFEINDQNTVLLI